MSSQESTPRLKHGEEPTELLLALISSPLETLLQRKQIQLFSANTPEGKPVVLAVFLDAALADGVIVLANGKGIESPKKDSEPVKEV